MHRVRSASKQSFTIRRALTMRKLLIAALSCASFAATTPVAESKAEKVEVTNPKNGATISVPEGHKFVLRLTSNPTTGYSWRITLVDKTFGSPKSKYKQEGAPGLIGAGGHQ